MNTGTVLVNIESQVRLAYIDSGPPHNQPTYETIFAVHGHGFSNAIFKKLFPLCPTHNVRIVALNRRGYPGSTPYTPAECAFMTADATSVSETEKEAFVRARGLEILHFIDEFIQQNNIPPISATGNENGQRKGGIALLGWSLGVAFTLSAIANVTGVETKLKTKLGDYLRDHIMLEIGAVTSTGIPTVPGYWYPFHDPNLAASDRAGLLGLLVSGYYDHHRDLRSDRDPGNLSHVAPSVTRIPSVYNMTSTDQKEIAIILNPEYTVYLDLICWRLCSTQNLQMYHKACFDDDLRTRGQGALKGMRVWDVVGTRSHAGLWVALWVLEEDDRKAGGGYVRVKTMEGANHFMHWDDPEQTMDVLREILDSN